MKVSELTLDLVKQYLRIDGDDDNILVNLLLESAKAYASGYMGCTIEDMDQWPDVTIAILAMIADTYEVRQFTTSVVSTSPLILGALDMHCVNLLAEDDEE